MSNIVGLDGKPIKKQSQGRLPTILVGIPCGLQTFVAFEDSLQQTMVGNGEQFLATIGRAVGHITADGRNEIVNNALKGNFDYVMFFDSDMIFPAGTILKMLKRCYEVPENELPIIGGVYNTRSDHRLNIYKWLPDRHTYESVSSNTDPTFDLHQEKLYKTDGCGTGCMLIDCAVFEAMEYPWFTYEHWRCDDKQKEWWSEDLVFCKKLYDMGIHIYIDTNIVCKHILPSVVVQVDGSTYQVETIMGTKY